MAKSISGPNFPSPAGALDKLGLSVRDYFAAAALSGLLARDSALANGGFQVDSPEKLAKSAYALADEMVRLSEGG